MHENFLSVAICTYNRARSLERALASIERSDTARNFAREVLVVDNNSSDDTRDCVASFQHRLPVHYHCETKQGLSHARNRAIREFAGDLLLFTDDDVEVGKEWLAAYYAAMADYPSAEYFGGRIIPRYEESRPGWLKDETLTLISGLIGLYDLGNESKLYSAGDMHPFGANFALKRSLIDSVGFFSTDLGVKGSTPGRGEEAEYFQRVQLDRYPGVYLHDAICYHYNAADHFTLSHLYSYGREKGKAERYMNGALKSRPLAAQQAVTFVKGLYQLLKGRPDRFRQNIINLGIAHGLHEASGKELVTYEE
jgi:glycosyltransferase involved in cell wall biosynthesis